MTHGLQSDDACPDPDLRTQDDADCVLHGSCDFSDSSVLLQQKVVSTAMSSQLTSTNASFDKFACMGRLSHFYDIGKQAAKFGKNVGNDPLFPMDITSIDPSLPSNHHTNSWQSFQQVAGVPDDSSVPVIGQSGPDWHDIEQYPLGIAISWRLWLPLLSISRNSSRTCLWIAIFGKEIYTRPNGI